METIGQRITRLRIGKGWSRPELGRKMAEAIHRAKPFTGEVVRLYEDNKHVPGKNARAALALVFGKSEQYILFGESQPKAREELAAYSVGGKGEAKALSARQEILLDLFDGLFSLQQRDLIDEMRALFDANQITRKELGHKLLRGVSNATVAAAFGPVPHPAKEKHHSHKKKDSAGHSPDPNQRDDVE